MDPTNIIFGCVGVVAFFLITFICCIWYRLFTGKSIGRITIVRDNDGQVVAMESKL